MCTSDAHAIKIIKKAKIYGSRTALALLTAPVVVDYTTAIVAMYIETLNETPII